MRQRGILVLLPPLPLPRFRFRFHENIVILFVAIPPTNAEAASLADRFRFRFRIPESKETMQQQMRIKQDSKADIDEPNADGIKLAQMGRTWECSKIRLVDNSFEYRKNPIQIG